MYKVFLISRADYVYTAKYLATAVYLLSTFIKGKELYKAILIKLAYILGSQKGKKCAADPPSLVAGVMLQFG